MAVREGLTGGEFRHKDDILILTERSIFCTTWES